KEFSIEWLETKLRQSLCEGGLALACKAVVAADQGDAIADEALRDVGAELLLQRPDLLMPGHLQIISYLQRVTKTKRPPHKRKPGRYGEYDHWVRDIGICLLIHLACKEFGVKATRNRENRRANRKPSGCSLVKQGLARRMLNLEEKTIQEHIFLGL